MTNPDHDRMPVSDVLGVGFGPSNLALAVAVDEYNAVYGPAGARTAIGLAAGPSADPAIDPVGDRTTGGEGALARDFDPALDTAVEKDAPVPGPLAMTFLERQPRFGWHRGMLLEGSTIQVSFLKDLVTMRNPASRFSFLSYLHSRDRLVDFINHKCLFPSRAEFHDYLEWVAEWFTHTVEYRSEVVSVTPVRQDDGGVTAFDVLARRGQDGGADPRSRPVVRRCRNLVLATGLEPRLPDGLPATVRDNDRVWHNEELLLRLRRYRHRPGGRFVVVGAGQGAAETVEYLHRAYPDAEVCAVFARYGYSPADDTPFANRIFDPEAVDTFFGAPDSVKAKLLGYHANTNYSVVDPDLITELYRRWYQEKVQGQARLRILHTSRVVGVEPSSGALRVVVEDLATGDTQVLGADTLIYATGYRPSDPMHLLGEAAGLCATDGDGRPVVERDYRVATDRDVRAGIYLQGPTEHSHGLTSTLLSTAANRAGEIVRSIAHHSRRPEPPPVPAHEPADGVRI